MEKRNTAQRSEEGRVSQPGTVSVAKNFDLIEKKHEKIVVSACKLFFEKGYGKTTIREIAVAAGMSMGQLYHYISSKDDVLFLIYKQMQMIWYDHLSESGLDQIQDPVLRLKRALYSTLELMLHNRDLFLFIYTETKYLEKKYLRVVLEMDDKNVVGFWRRLLNDLAVEAHYKEGEKEDTDLLANLISYIMVFIPLRGWNLDNNKSKEHINGIIRFILGGLGIKDQIP